MKIEISCGKLVEVVIIAALIGMQIYNSYRISELNSKIENFQSPIINQPIKPIQPSDWQVDCGKDLNGYDAVFIYLPTCPHCQRMEPLVKSSELKFYWIDPRLPKCSSINLTKFDFKGFVPHFYCLKNGNSHIGEMPEESFRNWTESCK